MLSITIGTKQIEKGLDDLAKSQLKYATSRAVNASLRDAQSAMVGQAKSALTIRNERFLKMSYKITKFSNKIDLSATLALSSVGNRDTTNIFQRLEEGDTKTGTRGGRVAIPTKNVKTSAKGIITKANRPKALKNSFKAELFGNTEGIYQKFGTKKNPKLKVMYVLKNSVRIPDKLEFNTITPAEFNRTFDAHFDNELSKAIATAKLS
jgi:hypothetical protein